MIIYVSLEVQVRELQSYLLFATVAASRGHQVVIGSFNDLVLYKRLNVLEKGCFFSKNVNIPKVGERFLRSFEADGFDLYCQEQEPSVLRGNFEAHTAALSITRDQYFPFKKVFCWGDRCVAGFKRLFKEKEDLFLSVGCPRVDVWKDHVENLNKTVDVGFKKPYILFVSNFSLSMGKLHWTENFPVLRMLDHLESYEQQKIFIGEFKQDSEIAVSMIQAVKYLSLNFKEFDILIRPHPTDNPDYWNYIFEDSDNVYVTGNSTTISPWIRHASLVVQNGCTSAFEAVVQKVPLVSYGPDRLEESIPNKLGMRVKQIDDLDDAIKNIFGENADYDLIQSESESILEPLISISKDNSSLKMVEVMEEMSCHLVSMKISNNDVRKMRLAKIAKEVQIFLRRIFGKKTVPSKIRLDEDQINEDLSVFATSMGLPVARAKLIGKETLIIGDI